MVLKSLDLDALAAVSGPINRWLKQGRPMPRLFSPGFLATAADVFPIEILDISNHHVLLHGTDPFAGLQIDLAHLRLQCERELREKMMRLQEAYLQARGRPRDLQRLVAESYPAFVLVFRGCLRLLEEPIPTLDLEVVRSLCRRLDLEATVFEEAEAQLRGHKAANIESQFRDYYQRLNQIMEHIDRFVPKSKERSP